MPQPIDLQTEVGRVATAERIQQVADRASLAAQQRVASEAQERRVESETQVQQTPQPQSDHIDAEGRRRTPFAGRRRRRRPGPDASDQPPPSAHRDLDDHHLDVSV